MAIFEGPGIIVLALLLLYATALVAWLTYRNATRTSVDQLPLITWHERERLLKELRTRGLVGAALAAVMGGGLVVMLAWLVFVVVDPAPLAVRMLAASGMGLALALPSAAALYFS